MSHNRFILILAVFLAIVGIVIAVSLRELEAYKAARIMPIPLSHSYTGA